MKEISSKLSGKQQKALIALLDCPNMGEAAKAASISESTLWRWLQNDAFKKAYRKARAEVVQHTITRLQQTCSEAAETLRTIMIDRDKPAATRVQAAKIILETSIKAGELEEMDERIGKLEQYIEAQTNR